MSGIKYKYYVMFHWLSDCGEFPKMGHGDVLTFQLDFLKYH